MLKMDELPSVFRSLSRGRRQGILELSADDYTYTVLFNNGKISSINTSTVNVPFEICKVLIAAGVVADSITEMLSEVEVTTDQLKTYLIKEHSVDEKQFDLARRSVELNILYSLKDEASLEYEFKPQVVKIDEHTSLAMYPSQVLLDMAAYAASEIKFKNFIPNPDNAIVFQNQEPGVKLTQVERDLMDLIAVESSVSGIKNLSLLSDYEFKEGILVLLENEILAIELLDGEAPDEHNTEESFGLPQEDSTAPSDSAIFPAGMVPSPEEANFNFEAGAALEDKSPDVKFEEISKKEVELENIQLEEMPPIPAVESEAEFEDISVFDQDSDVEGPVKLNKPETNTVSEVSRPTTPSELFAALSESLLADEALPTTAAIAALPFLIAVAILVPSALDVWFQALAEFTLSLQ